MSDKLINPTPFLPTRKLTKSFQKMAFYAWLEGGTCKKAEKMLPKRGIVNPITGKPYTYMAVYLAAYIYLVNNHEELKSVLFDLWNMREGIDMTDGEWDAYIVLKASVALGNSSKARFLEWIDDNPWAREYDYIYAKRFGLTPTSSPKI